MSVAAGGYVTDLLYPGFFHRETSPVWIATTVAATGQQAPALDRSYRYLDLGCGQGVGTALLAAANPGGTFVGVDVNPRHVERGRELAALLPNMTVVEAAFDTLAAQDEATAPFDAPFDFIVAHGVYSWVSSAMRDALRRIVQLHLAPGGVLYLHYTSHPGHSVFAGAQAMLRHVADATPGGSHAKLDNGLALLRALEAGGAGYFQAHPAIGRMLLDREQGAAYLAHDLLAPDWTALHAGEVIGDMEEAGCVFIGSAAPLDNIDALSVPGASLPVIARIGEVKARETARDLARNQSVRRDLYRRGLAGLTPEAYRAQLDALRYQALPGMSMAGDLTLAMPIGPVSVEAALVDPVRDRLRQGGATFAELGSSQPGGAGPAILIRVLLMLTVAGEIHAVPPGAGDPAASLRLNRALVGAGWLAAPAIGSAITVDEAEREVAAALLDDPTLAGGSLCRAVPVLDAGTVARTEERTVPLWRALGILPAA